MCGLLSIFGGVGEKLVKKNAKEQQAALSPS